MKNNIILTTTNTVDLPGVQIDRYLGLVTGDTVIGANIVRDIFAGLRDIFGGRSNSYEQVLAEARESAVNELINYAGSLGADAVIGLKFDFGSVGAKNSMFMVSVTGTAVKLNRTPHTNSGSSFV